MSTATRFAACFVAAGLLCGCKSHGPKPAVHAASARSSAIPPPETRVQVLTELEARRDSQDVRAADLASRNVRVRRRAARALARIGGARAAKLLVPALADEDARVDAWAAYGLGRTCRGRESTAVRALVVRAASLSGRPASGTPAPLALTPVAAIAGALARCGTSEAERTLEAWLAGTSERAEAAALALAELANRKHRLQDSTLVALLDAASRHDHPLSNALAAFARLSGLSTAVRDRLLSVAQAQLTEHGDRLSFAVRALEHAGPKAVPPLARVLADPNAPAAERACAARELTAFGKRGQHALGTALAALAPSAPQATEARLVSDAWAPLWATLQGLKPPARAATRSLDALAKLPVPAGASSPLERRIVELRCGAAAVLAGSASLASRLVHCDPAKKQSRARALSVITVLDRGPLAGARYARWKAFTRSKDAVVREAALELMPMHPEIPKPYQPIVDALGSSQMGVVATAAQVIAEYPDRVATIERPHVSAEGRSPADGGVPAEPPAAALPAIKPKPGVVHALVRAFDAERPADATDVTTALIDAAGALQLLSLKSKLEGYCKSENQTLRLHAERALRALGDRQRTCSAPKPAPAAPPELSLRLPPRVELELSTDVGLLRLVLDSTLAPVTVARVVELARSGFYDGIVVHRAVPGFVVQFGDPSGDGYGGAGRAPLPSETSPLDFSALSVGLAIGGRDTGSSQLFVTLGAYPHLNGDYPLIGRAEGDWQALSVGDVIRKVRVVESN